MSLGKDQGGDLRSTKILFMPSMAMWGNQHPCGYVGCSSIFERFLASEIHGTSAGTLIDDYFREKIQRNLSLFSFTFLYINKLEFCPFLEFGVAVFGTIITTTVASLTNTTIMSRKQELPKQFFRVLGVVGNVCGYGISSILDQTSCSAIQ